MQEDEFPKLIFETAFDERAQFEAWSKGYLSCVTVMLRDGSKYPVTFYDPGRLKQDLEYEVSSGRKCVADVGMIILAEVTLDNINVAIKKLASEGYFRGLKPI